MQILVCKIRLICGEQANGYLVEISFIFSAEIMANHEDLVKELEYYTSNNKTLCCEPNLIICEICFFQKCCI